MPPAARMNDNVIHDGPHCHAPIHPPAPVPTPLPHPPLPLPLLTACSTNVIISNQGGATLGSGSQPCSLPGCVPAGPGLVTLGSATVLVNMKPAARVGDMVAFAACVAPIPSPTGKIMPPGAPTVIIGG